MRLLAICLGLTLANPAVAADLLRLVELEMATMCIYQRSPHKNWMTKQIEQSPEALEKVENSNVAKCFRKHQWASEALCKGLATLPVEDRDGRWELMKTNKPPDAAYEYLKKNWEHLHDEVEFSPCPAPSGDTP